MTLSEPAPVLSELDLRHRFIGSVIITICAALLQVTYLFLPSLGVGIGVLTTTPMGPAFALGLLSVLFSFVWTIGCVVVFPAFWAYYLVNALWMRRWRASWLVLTLPLGLIGPATFFSQLAPPPT